MNYRNPIVPGFHPDPSICRVGADFYLATSSFEYFPGVPIFHSRDLVHWRPIGHALTRPSQLPLTEKAASQGIYAPTLRHHNGRFYLITTLIPEVLNFFVWTTDPVGEWSDPVIVDQPGIDPSLCFDTDGRVYCTSQGPGGAIQSEIEIETGRRKTLWQPIWEGSGQISPEGPHLYRIGSYYYLFVAEGGTQYGHMVTVARSESPWGPFIPCPHNPILHHFNARGGGNPIQGTGHADLVQAPDGSWWIVFLGFRPVNGRYHHLGRETFLAPVQWQDDWPVVYNRGVVAPVMDVPGPIPHPFPPEPTRDDFDEPRLRLCWNFLRNPDPASTSLTTRPGWLRLNGSRVTLDDIGSPTFVGRRQQHFQCRATTRLDFQPPKTGEEAGLTVFMNDRHHYDLFVTHRGSQRRVIVRKRVGDLIVEAANQTAPEGILLLKITADESAYRFWVGSETTPLQELATGETRYLSSEVAGGWTGVYLALFAQGRRHPCSVPADFDWFDYSEFYE